MLSLLQDPVIGSGFMLLLGACIGSFLNVVILRLPVMMQNEWQQQCEQLLGATGNSAAESAAESAAAPEYNLSFPASHCPSCHQPLKLWHNIPVLSFILLKGRCAFCQIAIPWRYPAIELATALATAHLALHFGIGWQLLAGLLLLWSLIVLTVIDLDHQILPDNITLPLLWAGLIANYFDLFTNLDSAVIGAVIGYLAFWIIYQIHYRLTGREGLGYGDFKLLAALGAWLGWEALPLIVLMSSLVGTIVAVVLMLGSKLERRAPISFGPFLALGGWISLLWGEQITRSYLQLLNF